MAWRLWTLYGWVQYNFTFGLDYKFDPPKTVSCGDSFNGNALYFTVGQKIYQQLADTYRIDNNGVNPNGLQYNYQNEPDPTQWFNPYVELLHSAKYVNMKTYAFSIDDAVGFQQHKGEGLIYAVGGPTGLQNPNELDPNAIVNVAFGYATDGSTYLWQNSTYVCQDKISHTVDLTEFPSYDFFPLTSGGYPCQVSSTTLNNGPVKNFGISQGPPNLTIDCNSANDPGWCKRITVIGLDRTPLHHDHIIGPAVSIK